MRTQDTLPQYLKMYCIEHDVNKYTHRDHAAWRYIMRRAVPFFDSHGVTGYKEGLSKTGIEVDRIPHIDRMDQSLREFGWGAVPVCGFIPPWAFLEFQARKILPIATDMRSVDHIAYTPAPDIVHEAAGHAPILPDEDYNKYLAHYAKLGTKAIYSKQDLSLYEAVRYLSDIKEKPESTADDIDQAERRLDAAIRSFYYVSEATKVGRMSWWTAEYGMAGSLENPKIFGAGLLSSVGESHHAIHNNVKRVPLSLDCTNVSFNITEPQPQLFVAENMKHLHDVLDELDETLAYRIGGIDSLNKALMAEAVTTTNLDSGLQVSGILTQFEHNQGTVEFIKYSGPVQLATQDQEIQGQGIARHSHGFSSPLGRFAEIPNTPISRLSSTQLESIGLVKGRHVDLTLTTGFRLKAELLDIVRSQDKIVIMTFQNCTITREGTLYYDPSWGLFDWAIGETVTGVSGGPAHRELYGEHEIASTESTPGRSLPYTESEYELFSFYGDLRRLRDEKNASTAKSELTKIASKVLSDYPQEWLLFLEITELSQKYLNLDIASQPHLAAIKKELEDKKGQPLIGEQIQHGLDLL